VQLAYHRDFAAVICSPTLHKKVPVPRTGHYTYQITPEGTETQIVAEYLRKYIGKVETLKETKTTFKNIINMLNRRQNIHT